MLRALLGLAVNGIFTAPTFAGHATFSGYSTYSAPSVKTTNYTVVDADAYLIFNGAASLTVTLPAAASYAGRLITLRTIAAQTVVSASANVVPLAGGVAAAAILAGTAGKWADLVSDGTNWQVMRAN